MVWCFIQLSQTLANTQKKIYMMKPMKLYERSEVDKTSLTSLTHTHTFPSGWRDDREWRVSE